MNVPLISILRLLILWYNSNPLIRLIKDEANDGHHPPMLLRMQY